MSRKTLSVLILFIIAPIVFAENEFAFRLMPQFTGAAGSSYFSNGFGAAAAFDWRFLSLPRNTGLGLNAALGFGTLSVAEDSGYSGFSMFEGGIGPFGSWRINDRFSLRANINAGLYHYQLEDNNNTRLFVGGALSGSFHLSPWLSLFAEGGYTYYAFSDVNPINALKLGLGISLNLGEILRPVSRVQGERIAQYRVFPVSFAWYERNSFATVRITNNEPNAITQVNVSFLLERYMNEGTVFAELPRLEPGQTVELPVTALFNESMLDLTANVLTNARISLDYRSLGAKKQNAFTLEMPVFHRNAMNWDDDRRAASFVSPRDPAAMYFARYVESAVRDLLRDGVPRNVQYAAALFETINLYGINYLIDPASLFVEKSGNVAIVDRLNYPYETLYYRGGDCSDLAILFCSLLEVLGIEGAFITIPGHLYAAFDIGDSQWGAGNDNIIAHNGKRWMPVEITLTGDNFNRAWQVGAREWRTSESELFAMHENWKTYQSVSISGSGDLLPDMPESGEIVKRFVESINRIR
ncbi:hypothetical protein AGMMS50293_00450 [Spirochaetia bacterium]|nr:hypothetical protein AGMMS50293_00450 [Spirochaetia bacterium]